MINLSIVKYKNITHIFLIIILICDLSYSFMQYYTAPLDGDVADLIVPNQDIQKVFDDPFGINVMRTKEKHLNTN